MRAKLPAILESASTTITFSVVVSVLFYSVGAMVWPVPRSLRHERSLWLAWWSWQWSVNGVLPRRFASLLSARCSRCSRLLRSTHRTESHSLAVVTRQSLWYCRETGAGNCYPVSQSLRELVSTIPLDESWDRRWDGLWNVPSVRDWERLEKKDFSRWFSQRRHLTSFLAYFYPLAKVVGHNGV